MEKVTKSRRKPLGRTTVDWAAFADGSQWIALQGTDFQSTAEQFCAAGRIWARRHGCTWKHLVEKDEEAGKTTKVYFSITKVEE